MNNKPKAKTTKPASNPVKGKVHGSPEPAKPKKPTQDESGFDSGTMPPPEERPLNTSKDERGFDRVPFVKPPIKRNANFEE